MKKIKFDIIEPISEVFKLVKKLDGFINIEEFHIFQKRRKNMYSVFSVEMLIKDSKDSEGYLVENWDKIIGKMYSTSNFTYEDSNKYITSKKDTPISLFGVKDKISNKFDVKGLTMQTIVGRLTRSRHAFGYKVKEINKNKWIIFSDVKNYDNKFTLKRKDSEHVEISSDNYDLTPVKKLF